jgi:alpha-tubulin suppressor-like RCC1 family protein
LFIQGSNSSQDVKKYPGNKNYTTSAMNLVATFSSMAYHSIFIGEDGEVYAWGANKSGALGLGDTEHRNTPCRVSLPILPEHKVVSVALGFQHTLVLTSNNDILVWGANDKAQLGLGDTEQRLSPVLLPKFTTERITQITCGGDSSMALTDSGSLFVWGNNHYGQLGLGYHKVVLTPICIPDFPPLNCAVSPDNSLFIDRNGSVWSSGEAQYGVLGIDKIDDSRSSSRCLIPSLHNVTKIVLTSGHATALTEEGVLYTWGWNGFKNLGTQDESHRFTPVEVLKGVVDFACGGAHTLALLEVFFSPSSSSPIPRP